VTDIRAHLEMHLHGMAAPFLFVGAGLSRRYAEVEGWEGLLRRFAEQTDLPYEYYRSSAEQDLPAVASAIAERFHELWWRDGRFAASRAEWADRVRGRESALKVEVARHLASASDSLPSKGDLARELTLLKGAVVDGVITTNFDPILETLFPEFRTFIGQDEMLFANPQGVGELYKIHGSCANPDSLVLTAADYDRFESRNPYLAAKLLTIFVEHPVIFLGYSLGDRNVISILRSIAGCLTQDNLSQLEDRLIFVQWEADAEPSVGSHTMLVDDFVIPVQRLVVPDFQDVFAALAALRRAFPAKLLRRLKEQVYDLVLADDPHERLLVADIDDSTQDADIDVVFGVGMRAKLGQQGYVGLDRWSLVDDVVDSGDHFDAEAVINQALPKILRAPGNVPVFKYLREAGALDRHGQIKKSASVPAPVVKLAEKNRGGMPAGKWHENKAQTLLKGVTGVADLEAKHGVKGVLNYVTCMASQKVDPDELLAFIRAHREYRTGAWDGTQYVKLVCFYDWLRYGRVDR
jgi:hypothetical protein